MRCQLQLKNNEHEIAKLPLTELVKFRSWFEEFDAESWDKQFENDVKSGKLENHAEQAIKDFNSGKYKKNR